MKKNLKRRWLSTAISALLFFTAIPAFAADTSAEMFSDGQEVIPDADIAEAAENGLNGDITTIAEDEEEAPNGDGMEITTDLSGGDGTEITADFPNGVDTETMTDLPDGVDAEITTDLPDGVDAEITTDLSGGNILPAEESFEDGTIPDDAEEMKDEKDLESTPVQLSSPSVADDGDEKYADDTSPEEETVLAVTGIALNRTEITLRALDQTVQLTAEVSPKGASDPGTVWSSSDASVVKVDQNGTLTAVKNGTATITVTTTDGNFKASCKVTVSLYGDGFHQDPDSTEWCYYKNGKISTGTTDLIQGTVNGKSGWWYVKKGRVSSSATVVKGTVDGTTAWWYVNGNGRVDTSYTGFAANGSGSWYVESGRVSKTVNGVFKDTTGALGSASSWYYVLNSKVQYNFTGLADYKNASGWWYITNGKVDRSVTTVAKNKNGWYYVKNGKVDRSVTTVAKNNNGWWYVKNGKLDRTYTGFASNENGAWYVESGKVSKKINGVYKDTTGALGSTDSWYYVLNSKVQYGFTGLADYKNASGWWYITNGRVDRSVTTVAKNKNGWYYVKNGKVDRTYTGFAKNENGSWYVESGRVSKKINGVYKDTLGALGSTDSWYYILNNKVQYDFTGLADYKNASGWWYITNGEVDRSVTTVAKNKNGWYYVKNGKVDRSYTGTAKNSNGWWYVENGKLVRNTPALVKTDGVWRAYPNGKLDTAYTGIAANSNGWWYIQNGKLDRSFTGIALCEDGSWYVKDGKVDFSYSGSYKSNGVTYLILNGKAQMDVVMVENSTLSGTELGLLSANKGLPVSRELTQDEFDQIIEEFMKSSYIKDVSYNLVTDLFVWNGGPRWDCSSTTLYLMNYYLLSYANAYDSAASANPSADPSDLAASAMASLGNKASNAYAESGSMYPINAATQAASWGNPVYTYKTVNQISDSDPGNLRYGDLLFYGNMSGDSVTITHVAVYLGQYYLADGDTGYYQMENTNYPYEGITEGNANGVRISPFRSKGVTSVLVHVARIF